MKDCRGKGNVKHRKAEDFGTSAFNIIFIRVFYNSLSRMDTKKIHSIVFFTGTEEAKFSYASIFFVGTVDIKCWPKLAKRKMAPFF